MHPARDAEPAAARGPRTRRPRRAARTTAHDAHDAHDAYDAYDAVDADVRARLGPVCRLMSPGQFERLVADVVTFKLRWAATGSRPV